MSASQELIVNIMRKMRGPIFGSELADLVGYSKSGMYKQLAQLVDAGLVEKAGGPRTRRGYQLTQRAA